MRKGRMRADCKGRRMRALTMREEGCMLAMREER